MDKHGGAYGLVIFSSSILQVMLGSIHWDWRKDKNKKAKKWKAPRERGIELFHLAILVTHTKKERN